MVAAALLGVGICRVPQAKAANLYWDNDATFTGNNISTGAGLGGTGNWDTTAQKWFNGTSDIAWSNSALDVAYFTGTAGTVNLGEAITVGGLNFGVTGYNITGDILTLAAPTGTRAPEVAVSVVSRATISSTLAGSAGLTKTGNGTLVLANSANTFTGDVTVRQGTLVVSSAGQLGLGTGPVAAVGFSNTGNPGFSGGSLLINGSGVSAFGTGISVAREITVTGRGPGAVNSTGSLITSGYNTLAGGLNFGSPISETRIWATHGTTTISGGVSLGSSQNLLLLGNGNWNITGLVTGADNANDRLIKNGTLVDSTLWLQNSANNFLQAIRIDNGTVRASSAGALGLSTSAQAIDLNWGRMEVRADNVTGFESKGVFVRNNTQPVLFLDHGVGGVLGIGSGQINQTVAFGAVGSNIANTNTYILNIRARNGFGASFTGALQGGAGDGTPTIDNAAGGLVTFVGDFRGVNTTTARNVTFRGAGDTILTGSISVAGAANHGFAKEGTGLMAVQGNASNYTGDTTVSGTLRISDVGSLNATSSGWLTFGGNTATLDYVGAGQTWADKIIAVNQSNGVLLANGTGPLVLARNVANTGAAGRYLVLGGASTADNELQGIFTNTTAGAGIRKIGEGTWVISSPGISAGRIGTANASLAINVTGTSATTTITTGSTATLVVGQVVRGRGVPLGTVITKILSSTQFLISQNIAGSSPAQNLSLGTVIGSTSAFTLAAASGGTAAAPTLTVADVPSVSSGFVIGQPVVHASLPASQGWFINSIAATSPTTATSGVSTGTTTAPILSFAALPAGLAVGQAVSSATLTAAGNWYISAINAGANQITLTSGSAATVTVGGVPSAEAITTSQVTLTLANATGSTLTVGTLAAGQSVTPAASVNYAGLTQISNGRLVLRPTSTAAEVINDSSGVQFIEDPIRGTQFAGGILEYRAFTDGSNETVGALTPAAGVGKVVITPGAASTTSSLSFAALGARVAGATLDFSTGAGGGASSIRFLSAPTNQNGVMGGFATITDPTTGAVDFLATPVANAAITALGSSVAFPATGSVATGNYLVASDVAVTGTSLANTLRLTGGNLTLGGNLSITATSATAMGGILHDNAGGARTISGFGITTSATNNELVITTAGTTPANALTISSALVNGTGRVTKSGNGTLVLSGANTFTGALAINEGTLRASGTAAGILGVPAAGTVHLLRQGATLDVGGAGASAVIYSGGPSIPILVSAPLMAAGNITSSVAGAQALQLGAAGSTGNGIISGVISDGVGTLALIKQGTGIQALSGLNTFTGPTVITAGTLDVTTLANGGSPSSIGQSSSAAANLVFNGGTLNYTGSTTLIYRLDQTPSVSIDRLFTLAGNGRINSNGQFGNSLNAASSANNAALVFAGTGDLAFAGAGARTLTLGGSSTSDNRLAITLRNNPNANELLSLTKVDGGLWILNPAASSTYTGITTISGGQLRAAVSGDVVGISANSPVTIDGGVLEVAGSTFSRALAASVAGAGTVSLANTAGFAAGTPTRLVVSLGVGATANADLTWGTTAGFANSTSLVLGSGTALGETEITNNINLGTSARTFTVNNNGNTGTMITAGILSGVISGSQNITKAGAGVLILGNANTFVGTTTINNGTVVASSIGGSGAASSFGASGALIFTRDDNDHNPLVYVGSGETATRPLTLTSSASVGSNTRTYRLEASGSGPLVWAPSTFTNTYAAGAGSRVLNLELRGSNTDANQLNAVLTNSTGTNTPALNVVKNDGGVWILNPPSNNTFTGAITVSGGLLGLTAAGIGNASSIAINNGGIFAFGADLVTSKEVVGNNSTGVFAGTRNITLNGGVRKTGGNNQWTISNNLEGGALLTVNGAFTNSEAGTGAATQTISIRGYGSTIWNGAIGENAAAGGKTAWNIALANGAYFTFEGSAANTYTGATTLTQGTLVLSKNSGVSQFGSTSVFNFNGGVLRADLALTGADAVSTPVTLGADPATVGGTFPITISGAFTNAGGDRRLINAIDGQTLTLAGPVNLSSTTDPRTLWVAGPSPVTISGVIANNSTASTNASSLIYFGTNTLLITGAATATGTLEPSRGAVTLEGTAGAWAGPVTVRGNAILRLNNATNASNARLADTGLILLSGGRLDLVGNSTSEAAGALRSFGAGSITIGGTGTNTLTFASVDAQFYTSGQGGLDLSGVTGLGSTARVILTGQSAGLMPKAYVGGDDFATYDAANGVRALAVGAYAAVSDVNAASAADILRVTSSVTEDLTATRSLRALALTDAADIDMSGAARTALNLVSGALLASGGGSHVVSIPKIVLQSTALMSTATTTTLTLPSTASLSVGQAVSGTGIPAGAFITAIPSATTVTLSAAATASGLVPVTVFAPAIVQVAAATSLDLQGSIVSNNSLFKAGPGTLQLSGRQFVGGDVTVAAGTLRLSPAGQLNAIQAYGSTINVEKGATLDLNGSTQFFGRINSFGLASGAGGVITSASAANLVLNSQGDNTFAGEITGASLNFLRTGSWTTINFHSASSFGGRFVNAGGSFDLRDDGALTGISELVVNYSRFQLNNNSNLQIQNNDRIRDQAPVFLRGGQIVVNGRTSADASERFGGLTLDASSLINVNTGGGSVFHRNDVTFASLTRNPGAVINFSSSQNLGQPGNNAAIFFDAAPTTVIGGFLGAWAISNSSDYAAYNLALGVGTVGQGGYLGYDGDFGTGKITQLTAVADRTITLPAGGATTAALRLAAGAALDLAFAGADDVLNLELGGLLRSNNNNASTLGTAAVRGILTAGGSALSGVNELIVFGSQNTLTINSRIRDNGAGAVVRLIKDGANTVVLTAPNDFTGGTQVNRGTLTLAPTTLGDVVLPSGGLTILGGGQDQSSQVNINASGAVHAGTVVTIEGRGILSQAAATTQTLASLSFTNPGAVAAGGVTLGAGARLSLTSSAPVTAVSGNAAFPQAITGGTLVLAPGANTFAIAPIVFPGSSVTYTDIHATLTIGSAVTGAGASIVKTGDGLLQLSGVNDFNGLTVNGGGVILGASAGVAQGGGGLSGPLGAGTVAMAAGTRILVDNNDRAVGNVLTWAGVPAFGNTGTTLRTLSLNGSMDWLGAGTPTIAIQSPYLTVALLGEIPNIASITGFNVTGPGALTFNAKGYTGDFNATALGNPYSVSLLHDGDGSPAPQTIVLPGSVLFDEGIIPALTVGRAGGTIPLPAAANKQLSVASVANIGRGLILTNNNGYGLRYSGNVTVAAGATYHVLTASRSNVTQGLEFSGDLTAPTGFTKSGPGALVLSGAANSIGAPIVVEQGVLSVASAAALGGAVVSLAPATGSSIFRASTSFTGSPVIRLAGTANTRVIEVAKGATLQLDAAFDLNAGAGATASLTKNDLGTLVVNASNTGWSGQVNINQGAILLNNPALTSPLGTGSIAISNVVAVSGAALRLAGGVTVSNPLDLQGVNNILQGGINFGGQLESVSGANTYAGSIAHAWDATIGSRTGSTLTLTGLITSTGTHRLQFNAEGDIVLTRATGSQTGALWGMDKYGAGTLTINSAIAGTVNNSGGFQIHRGTVVLATANGAITFGGTNPLTTVTGGAVLRLNNSAASRDNRINGRGVTLQGGSFEFVTNSTTETAGALTADVGGNTISLTGAGTAALTFASLTVNAGGTLNVVGTFGTATNRLLFTAAPTLTPATTGLLSKVTVLGNEFATYSAANGIGAFSGYAAVTNILSAAPTQTFRATSATANSLTGNQTLNALTISTGPLVGNAPAVGGLSGLTPTTLTLTTGALLVNGSGAGATASLSVPVISFGATGTTEGVVHVASGQTLNVTSGFSSTGGMIKSLGGVLNLNARQFVSGTTFVNGGTLRLQAGAVNTLLPNNALAVNFGGTVDLNGGAQFVGSLYSIGSAASEDEQGGTVTNQAGSQATLVTNANGSFGGVVSADVYLAKVGTNGLNLLYPQTYTGGTLIAGGSLTLTDDGSILNSASVAVRFGQLSLTNTNLKDVPNRLGDAIPITLTGGIIFHSGRAQMDSAETIGAVTLAGGYNALLSSQGGSGTSGTGINSAQLTIASLARTDASAVVRFNTYGGLGGTDAGNNRILFTTAPALTNGIIGPWAVVDREFASYDAALGVGPLNSAGFPGYSGATLNSAGPNDNVRHTTVGTIVLNADTTIGTLNFQRQNAASSIDLGGRRLTVRGGGLLFAQETDNITFSLVNGQVTSGVADAASDLFVWHNNFGGTNRLVSFDAAIVDNGTGAVRLIKSSGDAGASVMTFNGTNTYTGGTIVNIGTMVLGATGRLGTGGLTVNQATFTQTAGGVIPSQALTLNGGATVTLAGNNTLAGVTLVNAGGAAPTLNPTGVLTLTGGINASTSNPGTVSTVAAGILDLNGEAAFSVAVGAAMVNGVDVAPWQAGLRISSVIQSGGIVKTGAGQLELSGASTFAGGVTVSQGGLVLGASSSGAGLLDAVTAGPLGTGTLNMATGTALSSTGAFAVANNVVFGADNTGEGTHYFNGTNSLTLNGVTTLPTVWNAVIAAPQMNVIIGDAGPSLVTDSINKSGLGILTVGNYAGTITAAGGLVFSADGNGLSTRATLDLGGDVVLSGDTAVTVNRSGSGPNARNKTLQKAGLVNPGSILSVANLNGFGLEFTGAVALNGASHFAVSTASASNAVPGLTLSGVVSDAGGYSLTKSGPGTLLLTNAANTFGGSGATIDVLAGVLAASSDGALGASANSITLNVDGTTDVGFRATGSFSTNRTFVLNQANNAIEVTAGNVLRLNTAFTRASGSVNLTKNDNGVLDLAAANTGWAGAVSVAGGSLRLSAANALGGSSLTLTGPSASAIQLSGGVTVSTPLNMAATAIGINGTGGLLSVDGVNVYSGAITQQSGMAATIGALAGSTLTISGGITANNSTNFLPAAADSVINLASVITPGGAGTNLIGPGTLNITVNQAGFTGAFSVNAGTANLSGLGVTLGATGAVTVSAGGTFTVNDAVGATAARLNNRPVTIRGGTFAYVGNAANSVETSTAALTFARMGGLFSSTQTGSGTVTLTFASLSLGTDMSAGFVGANLGTASNRLLFTTAPTLTPATTGILPRATVNGASFATYGATNGLAAFTAYNATNATNLNSAGATDTVDTNVAMTTKALTASRTFNALRLSGVSAQTVSGGAFNTLTLTSGGLLATGAAGHALTVPILALGATQGVFHVDTGSSLEISSAISGTAGLVKEGAGTLTLSAPANKSGLVGAGGSAFTGNLTVTRGTLTLAGGGNTLAPGQFLIMGGPASTLDLNGTVQQISGLLTDTAGPGSGGVITSAAASGQLTINQDNNERTFGGAFGGQVSVVRTGQSTLNLVSASSTTGSFLFNGATTTIHGSGALTAASSVTVNYATLNLDNTQAWGVADRIADAAAITLRGGALTYLGRAQAASAETLGAVSVAQGWNVLTVTAGGTGVNSADLSLASLSRPAGSTGTINLTSGGSLGLIGSASRILVGSLNGTPTSANDYGANTGGLTNGIIGGWAVVGNEFATYIPGVGVAALNQTGAPQYDLSNTFTASTASRNVRLTATTAVPAAGAAVNSLTLTGANIDLTFGVATALLNITSGGLIGPNNNRSYGATVDSGRITAGGASPAANSDLFIYNRGNTLTLNARLVDNVAGAGSAVRAVLTASGGAITFVNTNASYTGGTVLNGGTLNLLASASGVTVPAAAVPARGLVINLGTVTMGSSANTVAGQIAASNIVTLNGGASALNLFGDNTLAGLVFDNNGGGANNITVTTFSTATASGAGSAGVLTIGSAGIVASASNIAGSNFIAGRVDFGATAKTVDVSAYAADGRLISALLPTLQLQGVVGSSGGITKTGNGVLQFNAPAAYTGPTVVNAGSIRTGATLAGSRNSALTLAAGAYLNLNGLTTAWGSLAGDGVVMNSSTTAAFLVVGFDGGSTVFSGQITRNNDTAANTVALQKVGTGVLTLTSAQNFATGTIGAITVSGGTLRYVDVGEAFNATSASGASSFLLNAGGVLSLDNSGSTNVNSRLGLDVIGSLGIQGGRLLLNGSSQAATATTETITTFNVLNGAGRVELTPHASNPLTLAVGTLNSGNGHGALVVAGVDGSASAAGVASLTIATPNFIAGQGAGANGTTNMSVRHDILADASVTGLGTGFLVRDSVTSNWRALAGAELNLVTTTWTGVQNAGVAASQALASTVFANTLTFTANATVSSGLNAGVFGGMGPGGLLTLSLSNASALLVRNGVTANINVGALQSTTVGITPFVHVVGNGVLNVNAAYAIGGTVGMMKAGSGVMNLNRQAYFAGVATVNGGTLNLLSGSANTLAVVPTQTATLTGLSLNGLDAVVDLRNRAQAVASLNSINDLPGQGGTVTNSGASIVPFTISTTAANSTFAGSIIGNISLVRSGGNTLTLTDASSYAGETVVRGGTLRLKDAGAITGTGGLKLYYGTLNWDNFGYNPVLNPVRVAAANPVFLRGGVFTVNGAGSTDTALTLNTVTAESGSSVINTLPYVNMGSTVSLTVGNLVRGAGSRSGINFNGWTTNNHSGTNSLGNQSLAASARVFLTRVNGTNFSESSLTDGLIGGWAVADGSTFATYSNTFGVVAMGNSFGGFTARAFDGDLTSTLSNTRNISDNADRTLTGAVALNSLRYASGTTARTVTFAAGATLALDVGFISNSSTSVTMAATDATNTLAGTGADLFLYNNQANPIIIEPRVTGAANFVLNGPATVSLRPKFGNNDYTGATFVNSGTLNLQGTAGRTFAGSVARGVFDGATIPPGSATVTMTSTAGLVPGMVLNNANFPAGTTILSVDSATAVTLINPSTNVAEVTGASFVAPASAAVTLTTTSGLFPGLVLNNANFAVGTTVLSVDSATQVTLSNASLATAAQASQTLTAPVLSFVAVPR
jgi:autotransporter-associated beta strand protein